MYVKLLELKSSVEGKVNKVNLLCLVKVLGLQIKNMEPDNAWHFFAVTHPNAKPTQQDLTSVIKQDLISHRVRLPKLIKPCRTGFVLGWVTAWEYPMLSSSIFLSFCFGRFLLFLFFSYIPFILYSLHNYKLAVATDLQKLLKTIITVRRHEL